jgi:flagellin
MSSINTNAAAMTALQALTQTNKSLTETQSRISTGFRVASAADNAAYWSIATTRRSDNMALSTVQDALGLGAATVDVAYTAVNAAIKVVDQIKSKLVAAREPGIDRGKVQSDISALQDQLRSIADSANFSGQNWLKIDTTADPATIDKSIVSSFARDNAGEVSVGTITVNLYTKATGDTVALFDSNATASAKAGLLDTQLTVTSGGTYTIATLDISGLTDDAADLTDLDDMISAVDAVVSAMTDAATTLGSVKSRIGIQQQFVKDLMDAVKTGIGGLVDADMNEESTKLQALQVKQQLGVQALGIANASDQSILKLFQ